MFLEDGRTGKIEIEYKDGIVESCRFMHSVGAQLVRRNAVMPAHIEAESSKVVKTYRRGKIALNVHQGIVLNADFTYNLGERSGPRP